MSEKSYVSIEQAVCVVCAEAYDTGNILMDKRLKPTLEPKTIVPGWGMCPEHAKLREDNFVALIGCDPDKSKVGADNVLKPENAHRTGHIGHLRKHVFEDMFNVPVPDNMVVFCDEKVIHELEKMVEKVPAKEEGTQTTDGE